MAKQMQEKCAGLGFIGDPHISPRCPARRMDADYLGTVLGKLGQAIRICNARQLQPVCTGDLFERPRDKDSKRSTEMLTGLLRVLAEADRPLFVLPGNHDKHEVNLTDDTHLAVVESSGLARVIDNGQIRSFELENGSVVSIHGCPAEMPVPESLEALDGHINILLTHHDFAFPGAYPNALPIKEIPGADIVVNGHMHGYQEPRMAGQTKYCNPGNIIRQTYADKEHVPSISVFDGHEFERVSLSFQDAEIVFDESGYQIEAQQDIEQTASVFVQGLEDDRGAETLSKSEDGGLLKEIMASCFEELKTRGEVREVVEDLLERQMG